MVSNDEIKRMLDAKRRGLDTKNLNAKSVNYHICPHCRFKNPEKAIFCVKCGKKLEKNVNIKCNSCGAENAKTAKFCVECGENLTSSKYEIESEPNNENEKFEAPNETLNQYDADQTITDNIPQEIENESNQPLFETIPDDSNLDETNQSSEVDKEVEPNNNEQNIKPAKNHVMPSSVPDHNLINQKDSRKTCESCNSKNLKNAKFCVVCGEKFSDNPTTVETTKESDLKTEQVNVSSESSEIDDPIEKIKKAKELMDIGAITSEEFETIKRKYLEKI